jgi:hypothetical protein
MKTKRENLAAKLKAAAASSKATPIFSALLALSKDCDNAAHFLQVSVIHIIWARRTWELGARISESAVMFI